MERTVLAAVTERPDADSALAEQLRRVCAAMGELGLEVRWTHRAEDALAVVGSDASLSAVLVSWDAPGAEELLGAVSRRFRGLPVFLMTQEQELPLWAYEVIQGFVFPLEDTPQFIAGRIAYAAEQYAEKILPPFFAALRRLEDHHRYRNRRQCSGLQAGGEADQPA
ncbi:Orn/Lys/Arg decarboxylase N-terminal domain-containing protein [Nonomuraea sp. NPDC050153]|uniref:Orn/Lys/Arg decarboxylase N-terminal domain-containing protein n=1 Tax=Nonomuraea sp. NPDC050153 TaxID=3364359 RepID=UPI0037B32CB7